MIAPAFERRTLEEITTTRVRSWVRDLDDRGYAASTVRKAHQLFASIMDFAVAGGLIPKSQASKVALPRLGRVERRFLPVEEVERLATAAGRYGTCVCTLAYCGTRSGETPAVRVGDLDLFRRRMSIIRTMVELNGGRISFNEPNERERTIGIPESLVRSAGRPVRGPRSRRPRLPITARRTDPLA